MFKEYIPRRKPYTHKSRTYRLVAEIFQEDTFAIIRERRRVKRLGLRDAIASVARDIRAMRFICRVSK